MAVPEIPLFTLILIETGPAVDARLFRGRSIFA
jgi:hypothetical protein